jgi:hypothetical protein
MSKLESMVLWKFNLLPQHLKNEMVDFLEFLFQKNKLEQKPQKKIKAGFLKGTFKIKEGFYDDLDDFKDYQ